ncbi:MAG: right-handed parallel beta-helix repeat-containing protein [Methylobacteriaceae bacterium]|nr:right-handed parallel beta-helix repeat-containing protein [Methylobacteriaceae bacterium]MBV9244705.1 right-handed parallel beta-helix repeat-containing protein [Methylobacteriaceae bacterium]
MRNTASLLASLGVLLAFAYAGPAWAQNARSWVASDGSDANPCTRANPCATFIHALLKTNAGGEINCVDQGDYGGNDLFINKSITIDCEGVQARFGFAGVAAIAIVVSASPTDVVVLRGIDIYGSGVADLGIDFAGGAALHIEKCIIRDFATGSGGWGIFDEAAGATPSVLFVSDTVLENNGTASSGGGIDIQPITSGSTSKVVLNRVEARNNFFGIKADGTMVSGGVINMTVRDSVSSGNASNGIVGITSAAGAAIVMMIDHSASSHNAAGFGVLADGPNVTIRLASSSVAGNINGVGAGLGGVLQSYGTNEINGNSSDGIASLTPIGLH